MCYYFIKLVCIVLRQSYKTRSKGACPESRVRQLEAQAVPPRALLLSISISVSISIISSSISISIPQCALECDLG